MATVRLPDRPGRNHISVAQIPREELANTVTHAAGIALGVAATAVLTVRAIAAGDPRRIFAFLVFGFTIVLLYTASTLYHGQTDPRRKARLQVFDHVSIYYLIAGSYTPVALVGLRGAWGWAIFGAIWALAIAGTAFKLLSTGRFPVVSTILYIAMGWISMVAIVPLVQNLSPNALLWLLAGGLFYTGGVAFYSWRRLPFNHAIWHLFVLAGTASHFVAILGL